MGQTIEGETMADEMASEVEGLKDEMVALRRDLHRHPELAFQERRTAGTVASRLEELGISVRTGVAETGVIGLLQGGAPGPTVMIRADIDALPVQEVPGRPYSSVEEGKMHACGHDGHTTILVAVAKLLAGRKGSLKGRVKLVFQPAEETMSGAQPMVEEGVMENPKVDRVLVCHLWSPLEVGTVGVRPGPIFVSTDEIRVLVKGKGGHGGLPHLSVDPVVIAAHTIVALQSIVSREVDALQRVVLSFGRISGGTQFNIIPDEVRLEGNLRTLDEEVRSFVMKRVAEVAGSVAAAMRGRAELVHVRGIPPVVNDREVTEVVAAVAGRVVGKENVIQVEPVAVGDDAALFLERAPGCYFLVGAGNKERGITAPHHNPEFDIDEAALPIAARILAEAALHYLS